MRRLCVFSLGTLMAIGLVLASASGVASAHSRHSRVPRVRSLVPMVRSIVPDHGAQNGGTTVLIKGSNVIDVTGVNFGSEPASDVTVRSQNSILATSPPGSGTVNVTVVTPNGTSPVTSADQFTYESAPTIQSLSPRAAITTGGTKVTISGSGFTGTTSVDFGTDPAAEFTVESNIAITAVTPAESAGQVDVTVSGANGTSPIDPADAFTFVLRIPVISGVTPDNGPQGGGTQVVITGSQFMKRGTSVFFGGVPAQSFSVLGGGAIMAVSPAGSGTVDVTVTDSRGTSVISPSDQFTYTS